MYKKYTIKLGVPNLLYHKILLIMRLTTVLLIASLMQVSAASLAQRITFSKKNTALESVLREIRKQSGFDIIFDGKIIAKNQLISVDVKNADISQAMSAALEGLPLSYSINRNIITINRKETGHGIVHANLPQERITVRGKVVDEKSEPILGASVFVEGDPKALGGTNLRGEFTLLNVDAKANIIIAYMGYKPVTIPAKPNVGTIKMESSTNELSEVEVTYNTGYERISRERAAGSFAKPDLNVMLNRTSTTNILTRLEGLVPGLTTRGPGGLLVRGQSSIPKINNDAPALTSTRPLIVVDGIEFEGNIEQINMQDVEDINILKDATSASIWGAKAANGVIVITTKRGKTGDKLTITYDGYYAFQGRQNLDYVPRLSSKQFIDLSRELFPQSLPYYKDWRTVNQIYSNLPHLQIQYDRARGLISQQQADFKLDSLAGLSNTGQIANLFYQNAATINQTVSVTGGGKVHSFYGSFNHIGTRSDTIGIQSNQYKINLNNTFTFKRVTASVNADLTNTVSKNGNSFVPSRDIVPYQLFQDAHGNPLNVNYLGAFSLIGTDPTQGIALQDSVRADYQARSRVNLDYNPVLDRDRARTSSNGLFARLVGNARVNILKGLDFQGTYGYNIGNTNSREVWDQNLYNMRVLAAQFTQAANTTTTPVYNIPAIGGRLNVSTSSYKAWTLRNQLLFNQNWEKHQISVMVGQQATSSTPVTTTGTYYGWDDQLQTSAPVDMARLNAGITGALAGTAFLRGNNVGGGEGRIARTTSYFTNLGYTYASKYTLNASWRIDKSNLFGRDKSAQNRPVYSVGGKWALGFEEWMKPLTWLNRLDLRLTYGITGNAPFAGAASSYDILTASSNVNYVTGLGYLLQSPANTKLTWESTQVYNAGFDFVILQNRLSGSVDGYIRKTRDLIGELATSPLTGYATVIGNYGSLDNKGIDIGLNSTNIHTRNFSWNTGLTFSYNKNKLSKLQQNPPSTGDAKVNTNQLVGYPLNSVFVYDYAGLNNVGDPQVRRADGTVTAAINVTMPGDILYAGTFQPVWSGGLQNSFQYKSFGLSANIIYSGGNVVANNNNPSSNEPIVGFNSYQLGFLDRWKVPGDENRTDIPRYVPSAELQNARNIRYYTNSQRYALNASYAKLRDITLSYSLPQKLVSRVNAQSISFRVQLNNLLLWTANKQGMDPEAVGQIRPAQGTVSLGAHITF